MRSNIRMVEFSSNSPAHPGSRRPAWRRILHWVLIAIGFGIPAIFIVGGIVLVIVGLLQTSAQWRDDLISSGIVYAVFGAIWAALAGVVVLMSRRKRARPSLDEKVLDRTEFRGAARAQPSEPMEAAFAPPAVPSPVSIILPWTVTSRPSGIRNPWWLLPAAIVVMMPFWAVRLGAPRTMMAGYFAFGILVALAIGYLQWAYVFRRRVTVDQLDVTFRNAFGQMSVVARTHIRRIALRTLIGQRVMEDRALLVDSDGRCVMRIARFGLSYEQASHFAGILRVPIDGSWDHPATFAELEREFPGSATWSERHRVFFNIALMLTILLFVAATVALNRIR